MPIHSSSPHDPKSCQHLAGKTAVVTGSSSGIGQAVAIAFAVEGANVLVHARENVEGAEETAAAIRNVGQEAKVILADLSIPTEQDRLVQEAWAWNNIDIWMNNAGVDVLTGDNAQLSFEEKLAKLWAVDVAATMQLSRATGERMQQMGHGNIINIGWDQAWEGMEGDSGQMFAAVKGSVMAFTKSLAKSLAPQVRVNAIAPGWIQTAWGDQASEDWQNRAKQEALLERWGTPEDIANAACFLASDASAFVNGQILNINGGFSGNAATVTS